VTNDASRPFPRCERGASAVEWALIVALVALAGLGAWQVFGESIDAEVTCVAGAVSGTGGPCGPGSGGGSPSPAPPPTFAAFRSEAPASGDRRDMSDSPDVAFDELEGGKGAEYRRVDGPLANLGEGDRHAFDPSDVHQGQIGDCYLMSTLASLASTNPDLLARAITENGDGTYTVTFHVGNTTQAVTVSADFPVRDGAPVFAALGDPSPPFRLFGVVAVPFTDGHNLELWPPLFEKAYAKLMGSYNRVGNGGYPNEPFKALTGEESQNYDRSDLTFDDVCSWMDGGDAVVVASLLDAEEAKRDPMYQDGRLVAFHDYYLAGVNKDRGTLLVQNPWGWNSWDGAPLEITFADFQRSFSYAVRNPSHRRAGRSLEL